MTDVPRLGFLGATDNRPAIVEPGHGRVSYAQLDSLADSVATRLRQVGVVPGGRIGLYLHRSADTIAAMLGTLRVGCAYVPLDPRAPVARNAEILADCRVQTTFVERRFERPLRDALGQLGAGHISVQRLGPVGLGAAIDDWAASGKGSELVTRQDAEPSGRDLAHVLYTSGTTGRPKGWMATREAIEVHTRWCRRVFESTRDDIFANYTQFNFGLSMSNIYPSLDCGAALVLIPDNAREDARRVVEHMAAERVSIWYSGVKILSLIAEITDLLSDRLRALRLVAFAGEVFPWVQLNTLRRRLPHPRYFHFYGSTEMNIAAYHELPRHAALTGPPPFGRLCEHYEMRVVGPDGQLAASGNAGELQVRGVGLPSSYWNQPTLATEHAADAVDGGERWFRTGDLVMQPSEGDLQYAGRIGRMVKLRGYRVEPGEIEARLYQHPLIREVGVVPMEEPSGLELIAHIGTSTGERLTTIELKEFCAGKLPAYMIPARFEFHASLPRTSSGKIDLQRLRTLKGPTSLTSTHTLESAL